jgi:hypothetical protein
MSWQEVAVLLLIEGIMDLSMYLNILQEELYTTIDNYGLDVSTVIFQQDNDLKHSSTLL